ncbi:MAG: iron ABC transporter permease, partial [Alphaproteobacteria bacterium]|nr:iron ABC transporter permease [Alphaproteobacteria bacterium]
MAETMTADSGAGSGSINGMVFARLLMWGCCIVLLAPIAALILTAMGDGQGMMSHLLETVLLKYFVNTFVLMFGVGALALVFGVSTAWIVSRYTFPGRRLLDWMLVLPAAVPAYIIAYTYTDFLEYAGPVQTHLRDWAGWRTSRDYWFPEIRSMGGAMLVMASVLYPYIYITARTAFRITSSRLYEAAILSGQNIFLKVALPLSRPAIVAGLALVLMEVISDFGTVDYFAVETLTLGIFNVWLGMNSITTSAQIAMMAFVLILVVLGVELYAQSRNGGESNIRGQTGV